MNELITPEIAWRLGVLCYILLAVHFMWIVQHVKTTLSETVIPYQKEVKKSMVWGIFKECTTDGYNFLIICGFCVFLMQYSEIYRYLTIFMPWYIYHHELKYSFSIFYDDIENFNEYRR